MTGFLEALGKKAAERWLAVLVLPGALWVATAWVAVRLGHRDALRPRVAGDRVTEWAKDAHSTGLVVAVLAAALLGSAAAGLAASGVGWIVRRAWMARGRRPPARWAVARRRRRWHRAAGRVDALVAEAVQAAGSAEEVAAGPEIADALARRDAIALETPGRPTWIGDRWRAAFIRVRRAYGLDLTIVWPRLWTVLPEQLRTDITTAQLACTSAATLTGWALLYGALAVLWWPAFPIGVTLLGTAVARARMATAALCELVETAADLYGPRLAEQLGSPASGPLTTALGDEISARLRKDPPIA
ncbi:hypothetical protein E1293_09285 [Actinomadura darangshiensis]|uniref:Vegetative cell wall protein gp1 n=1 Tax=Actinomadura darangshiensis TaxID=705336 RepID=A0A4R5BRR6_9ACTN|nr:hypothetical protein [Actinomadura darangshiensis]TDD86694.1 hypothetical protein E1293_09285 [Actinomadura darangshiensis]